MYSEAIKNLCQKNANLKEVGDALNDYIDEQRNYNYRIQDKDDYEEEYEGQHNEGTEQIKKDLSLAKKRLEDAVYYELHVRAEDEKAASDWELKKQDINARYYEEHGLSRDELLQLANPEVRNLSLHHLKIELNCLDSNYLGFNFFSQVGDAVALAKKEGEKVDEYLVRRITRKLVEPIILEIKRRWRGDN